VRRHESIRFSYVVQSSGVSAVDHRELSEYDAIEEGVLRRSDGACWDNCRATAGGRCAGGWSREELIVLIEKARGVMRIKLG